MALYSGSRQACFRGTVHPVMKATGTGDDPRMNSRLPFTPDAVAVIRHRKNTNVSKRVKGRIPRVGPNVVMNFVYYDNAIGFRGAEAPAPMVPSEVPAVDRRFLRLNYPIMQTVMNTRATEVADAERFLFVNPESWAYRDTAEAAAAAYDKEHGTKYADQLAFFFAACDQAVKHDRRLETCAPMPELKGLLVAQMLAFFESIYGVGLYDLLLLDMAVLLGLFVQLQTKGPAIAFLPKWYYFNRKGFELGSSVLEQQTQAVKAWRQRGGNHAAADVDEDADGLDEGPEVELHMKFARAHALWLRQRRDGYWDRHGNGDVERLGEDVYTNMDDDDSDDGEDGDRRAALQSGFHAAFNKTAPAKVKSSSSITIGQTVGSDQFGRNVSFLSSNFNKTRCNPLDMRRLTSEQWLAMLFIERFFLNYHRDKNFYMTTAMVRALFQEIAELDSRGEFPIKDVSLAMFERAIRHLTRGVEDDSDESQRPLMLIYDTVKMVRIDACMDAHFPPGDNFLEARHDARGIAVGLWVHLGMELRIGRELGAHVAWSDRMDMQLALREWEEDGAVSLDVCTDETGARVPSLAPEQIAALHLGHLLPLLLVDGPGGTGKSMLMRAMFLNLREHDPEAIFLFTSFKNDTVNQMRQAIALVAPDAITLFEEDEATDDRARRAAKAEEDRKRKLFFYTTDSYVKRDGVLVSYMGPDSGGQTAVIKKRPRYIFVDEAGMLSTSLVADMLKWSSEAKGANVLKMIMFGDGEQLEPINPGCPFADLVAAVPGACVRLTVNYRTSVERLRDFLSILRDGESELPLTFDRYPEDLAEGSTFLITDVPAESRTTEGALASWAIRFMKLLGEIDPTRTRHDEIMAVCPYNDLARTISACVNMYYFEGFSVDEMLAKQARESYQAALMALYGRSSDDDDDEPGPSSRKRPISEVTTAPDGWTLADAVAYGDGSGSKKPILRVGMEVVIQKTDSRNKDIAQGRVGIITHLVDHLANVKIKSEWFKPGVNTANHVVPGMRILDSTADDMARGRDKRRLVVLDHVLLLPFMTDRALHQLLKLSKCRTIHRAQGCQARTVIGLYPPGMLSYSKVWYTGASRARRTCFTLSAEDVAQDIRATQPPEKLSLLRRLLTHDDSLQTATQDLRTEANAKI